VGFTKPLQGDRGKTPGKEPTTKPVSTLDEHEREES
jgi:hypothetical protein